MKPDSIKKKMRRFIRQNFMRLPDQLRARLERRMFHIHLNGLDPELVFKIAETKDELEQAFKLLHDSYVREGYMTPHASGLRVTPYHALPTTTTLVAKKGNTVVGTVSLIRQSRLRLPIQSAFDLSQVLRPSDQAVEISSLAIHPKHRGQETQLLFWLSKYVFEYCQKYFAIDYMFITVNPRQIDLYENIILFQRLNAKVVENYGFANNAPAVAEFIDMKNYSNRLLSVYWNQPAERNVYAFIMVQSLSRQFHFPERAVFTVSDPVMTPELLDYFFNVKTSGFKNMTDFEVATLHELYRDFPAYKKVIPPSVVSLKMTGRSPAVRYQVQCPGTLRLNSQPQMHEFEILQVSESGFLGKVTMPVQVGDKITAVVRINHLEVIEIEATAVWSQPNELAGFKLPKTAPSWSKLVAHLTNDRNKASERRAS